MDGVVFQVMRFSIHDGPGIRTTVFLKGCPLRCLWCHNPESISPSPELMLRDDRCRGCGGCVPACPNSAITLRDGSAVTDRSRCNGCGRCVAACVFEAREMAGRPTTTDEVLAEVVRDIIFYDESAGGVTFSGGEPLLQHEFLLALLQSCRARGIRTAIDTTGYTTTEKLEQISQWTDLFLYDLKLLDDERHRRFTGVSNQLSLTNLKQLSAWGKNITVRLPVIPGINNDLDNIKQIGRLVESLQTIDEVVLLPYHRAGEAKYGRLGRPYSMSGVMPPPPEQLQQLAVELEKSVAHVAIGG